VWQDGRVDTSTVDDYSVDLPRLLAGRDHVERVEVDRESLEDIVLRMIDDDIARTS
jgi:hypothetical protein